MCARLLSCPLCSQPGFVTLDSLRAGLVSVATRPLACPVCNETLLGIDKLTIHLFGHTINANNRAEHKITDINCNNSVRLISHNGTMILPQNWNSQNSQTILSNRSQNTDVNCEDGFAPLSTLVVNKDLNSQGCVASDTEKSQNHIVFLQNSSQQEFCSPRLIKDTSLMPNSSNGEAYHRNIVPMEFRSTEENERIASVSSKICQNVAQSSSMRNSSDEEAYRRNAMPMVFCSPDENKRISSISSKIVQNSSQLSSMQNSSERDTYRRHAAPTSFCNADKNERVASISSKICQQSSTQSSTLLEATMYQREVNEDNSKNNKTPRKEETATQFSETWIENLLQDNNTKCFDGSSSINEDKNHSTSEEASILQNDEEEYSEYQTNTSNQSINSELLGAQKNPINSSDSTANTSEEIINKKQRSSPNSNEVLPKWKAFRLLAMKDKTERCNICGTHFPDRNFLVLHKQLAHMIPEKDVNATPEELLKNCPCHLCTKVFKTRGTLMVHMRVAHMGYNLGFLSRDKESEMACCENGFNCPTCGKNFRKEQHVTQHLKTHEGKQWECDVCSKMFTTKYFLKKHKRLHSGEMPYKCTICDKTFTFQQSYHKHRLYHKDDKPHTCATCGRSFKELSTLHNHERIHTGEKPFVCETCGKCFRQRVSYLVHRRIHTGVMPYKCTACGKSFRYKVSQRTHKCQAQPEDSSPGVVEASSPSHHQQTSRSDPSISENGILLQNPVVSDLAPSENNKFILIVNTHGQPILTREADVRATNNFVHEKHNWESQSQVNHDANPSDDNNLWNNHGISTEKDSKDCCANLPSRVNNSNEKLRTDDTNDFFSLVMSPLENDLSSPSTEMEHLRLESPGNEETRQNESHETSDNASSTNNLQRDLNNAIDGIFRDNRSGNSPLETINEESLKQLLYGIDRKNLE